MTASAVTPSAERAEFTPCVWVVDDDRAVLDAVTRLLRCADYSVRTFASGELLLAQPDIETADCIVLDLWMPGMTGLEVQDALLRAGNPAPVIFISAHGDVPSSVQAMKAGALDFLTKPFHASELIVAVQSAIARSRLSSAAQAERSRAAQLFSLLTSRGREVLKQLLQGKRNKEIAKELGAAEKTIKVHRSRVQQKMGVRSLAELASRIERAGLRECLGAAGAVGEFQTREDAQ
jgi:FixJ family two-component response regulator